MTEDNAQAFKTVKLPRWDGKKSTFQTWYTRFTAYAGVFGFAKALSEDSNIPESEGIKVDS